MKRLQFDEFVGEVAGTIREYLPVSYCDAHISVDKVVKNNNLRLTGLTIRSVDSNICPTIYLESFYKEYQSGEEIDEILSKIAAIRVKHEVKQPFDADFIADFEQVRTRIIPRLVGAKWNKHILFQRPYTMIDDLAVIYHIDMGERDFDGHATIPITNEIIRAWSIDVSTLHEQAVSNMSQYMSSSLMSMGQAIGELTGESFEEETMYVLSNQMKMFGATALLDKEMMDSIIAKFGEIYILPSSLHEVLIIKATADFEVSQLEDMVRGVNADVVAQEDRLSDHVYGYDIEKGLFSIGSRG